MLDVPVLRIHPNEKFSFLVITRFQYHVANPLRPPAAPPAHSNSSPCAGWPQALACRYAASPPARSVARASSRRKRMAGRQIGHGSRLLAGKAQRRRPCGLQKKNEPKPVLDCLPGPASPRQARPILARPRRARCKVAGPASNGEGVQDQTERKQPAKHQSNQSRDASLAHDPTSPNAPIVSRATTRVSSLGRVLFLPTG
jgi:hypothetical protein